MKAGKTNIEVGTRVKIVRISSNDPDDKALIGMTGEITHPFGGLMSPEVNYIAGVRLDDGSITNLTSGDKVKVVRGKGWHGDTPGHRKAALKAERKGAIDKPIRTRRKHTSFHRTRKPESDPTYSKEWSGVSHAPEARGKSCPKCGGHLHNEDGNYYCPHCDDYVHPVNQSPYR